MLRVLSLGAGVQSSTLLLMACEGELHRVPHRTHYTAFNDVPYLHDSRVPLGEADLRSEQDRGQLEMFDNDGCGVLCPADDAA
jgi:hypothetical protein